MLCSGVAGLPSHRRTATPPVYVKQAAVPAQTTIAFGKVTKGCQSLSEVDKLHRAEQNRRESTCRMLPMQDRQEHGHKPLQAQEESLVSHYVAVRF